MRTIISPLSIVTAALAGASCVETQTVVRDDHCAQQTGDAWCAERYPDGARPFCSRGACQLDERRDPATRDGCIAEQPVDDSCYSPCGDGSTVLEDASCLGPETTGQASADGTSDESDTAGDTDTMPLPVCGNGVLEADEACDDGDLNGDVGHCADGCQGVMTGCGDGEIQDGELCDDGDAINGNGCNIDCRPSGMVVWDRSYSAGGNANGVDVGADGSIYVAAATDTIAAAWAARIHDDDGALEWVKTVVTPPGSLQSNGFFAVRVIDEHAIAFGGRDEDLAHLLILDEAGEVISSLTDPDYDRLTDLVTIPGGYIAKDSNVVIRYDSTLTSEWSTTVGPGLAYRPGDDNALIVTGFGFQSFTLGGTFLEPVMFPQTVGTTPVPGLVQRTSSGEVVVAGQVVDAAGHAEVLVVKSTLDGDVLWMYGPEQLEGQSREGHCLAVDDRGDIVVGGRTEVLGSPLPSIVKLSAEGELLWVRAVEFDVTSGRVWGCTVNANDEIIAVGDAAGSIWVAKLTP